MALWPVGQANDFQFGIARRNLMRRLLLGLAVAASTLVPGVASADDTQIADFIQTRLQAEQQQGRLRGFNVDMQVEQGTVWFKGTVSNKQQEMLILQTAQKAGHLGVVQVVDDIEVSSSQIKPVGYQQPSIFQQPSAYQQPPVTQPRSITQPAYVGPASYAAAPARQDVYVDQGFSGGVISSDPLPFASCSSCGGGEVLGGEPVYSSAPAYSVGGGEPLAANGYGYGGGGGLGAGAPSGSPNLPGYAWPSYAAHPNFGAVSYPKQYSASAWPYIGPFYSYPQVPLGWRKVSLEWDDGFWHLDFKDKSRH